MVTLEEAKIHCRIELESIDFDIELQGCLDAAVNHLSSIDVDMAADPLPPAIKHAVLLLVGHFFSHKEAVNQEQLRFTPLGVDRLIAPYREVTF